MRGYAAGKLDRNVALAGGVTIGREGVAPNAADRWTKRCLTRCAKLASMKQRPSTSFETPSRGSRAYACRIKRAWLLSEDTARPRASSSTEAESVPDPAQHPKEPRPLAA